MRKLNWDNEELRQYSIRCLTAAWNVRYSAIHCLANLVSGLALYYEDVGIEIVDGVVEDIRLGLEVKIIHKKNVY
jgi:regulator of nonsense transcripts 2